MSRRRENVANPCVPYVYRRMAMTANQIISSRSIYDFAIHLTFNMVASTIGKLYLHRYAVAGCRQRRRRRRLNAYYRIRCESQLFFLFFPLLLLLLLLSFFFFIGFYWNFIHSHSKIVSIYSYEAKYAKIQLARFVTGAKFFKEAHSAPHIHLPLNQFFCRHRWQRHW